MGAPKGHPNYDTEGLAGRPLKYTQEVIEKEAEALDAWLDDPNNSCVFFTQFSYQRGYNKRRLNEFAEKNIRFALAFERAKEWQYHKLAMGALTKEHDAGFTKYLMGRVCGPEWRDTKDINVTSTGPVPEWIVDAEGKSKNLINE